MNKRKLEVGGCWVVWRSLVGEVEEEKVEEKKRSGKLQELGGFYFLFFFSLFLLHICTPFLN